MAQRAREKTLEELQAEVLAAEQGPSESDADPNLTNRGPAEEIEEAGPGPQHHLLAGDSDEDVQQLDRHSFGLHIDFALILSFLGKLIGPAALATLIEMIMLGKFSGAPDCYQPMNNGTTSAPRNNTLPPCPTVIAANGTAINGTQTSDPLFSAFGFDMTVVNLVAIPSGMLLLYAIYMLQSFLRHRAENIEAGYDMHHLNAGERSAAAKTGIDALKQAPALIVTTAAALAAKSALDAADFFASKEAHPNLGSFKTRLIWTTPIVEVSAALLYILLVEGCGRIPKPNCCDRRAGADRDLESVRALHGNDALTGIGRRRSRTEELQACFAGLRHAIFKCCEPKEEGATMVRRGKYASGSHANGGSAYRPIQGNM